MRSVRSEVSKYSVLGCPFTRGPRRYLFFIYFLFYSLRLPVYTPSFNSHLAFRSTPTKRNRLESQNHSPELPRPMLDHILRVFFFPRKT